MQFGEWEFTCDRSTTVDAYSRATAGGADTCTCNGCRNFVLVRDRVYPQSFVAFLESVGVDPHKDGEAYHTGEISPGNHHYGGWFHFVGSLGKTGDFPEVEMAPGFRVSLCRRHAPALPPLKDFSLVQVEFQVERVPWVLAGESGQRAGRSDVHGEEKSFQS